VVADRVVGEPGDVEVVVDVDGGEHAVEEIVVDEVVERQVSAEKQLVAGDPGIVALEEDMYAARSVEGPEKASENKAKRSVETTTEIK
jgi:hypothetical protein